MRSDKGGRRLTCIFENYFDGQFGSLFEHLYVGNDDISPKLPHRRIARDPVRTKREPQSEKYGRETAGTEPSRERRGIGRLPLGTKIGISSIIAGIAWLGLFRAFRPFGLLTFCRRNIIQGVGYGLLSLYVLALSYRGCVANSGWAQPSESREEDAPIASGHWIKNTAVNLPRLSCS